MPDPTTNAFKSYVGIGYVVSAELLHLRKLKVIMRVHCFFRVLDIIDPLESMQYFFVR